MTTATAPKPELREALASATLLITPSVRPDAGPGRRISPVRILVTPTVLILALGCLYAYVASIKLDSIEQRTLNRSFLLGAVGQHLKITGLATVLILVIAVPAGILLSRGNSRVVAPIVLGLANVGQAFPAIALLVLLTMELDVGLRVALVSFVAYGVLPVLRNTLVGLQQIDPDLVEAARGIGMTPWRVLTRVELPLAVPILLAGVRSTLVLTVGVATLGTFVNAGGLGDVIVNGLKLDRIPVQITGALLTVCVALFVDWLARLAEDLLRPRGL